MKKFTVNVQTCFHFNPISTYFLCPFVGQANSVLATIYLVCFEKIERFHFGERNHSSKFGVFFHFTFQEFACHRLHAFLRTSLMGYF